VPVGGGGKCPEQGLEKSSKWVVQEGTNRKRRRRSQKGAWQEDCGRREENKEDQKVYREEKRRGGRERERESMEQWALQRTSSC